MHEWLDVTVVALLNDLELFRLYTLCYTMGLLPKREGRGATAPNMYYLGHTELATVVDIDGRSCKILCTHFQVNGVWQKNEAVQQELKRLWRAHETEQSTPERVTPWLQEVRQRAERLEMPTSPAGQPVIHREHLKKALQAAVYQYIEEVKLAKRLG